MRLAELFNTRSQQGSSVEPNNPRPNDDELDLYGLTHPGKVRKDNQDQFLLCTIHPQAVVHATSLQNVESLPLRGSRMATMFLVADGVGGAASGADASRLATEAVTRYVTSTLRCYHRAGDGNDTEFLEALRAAALEAHQAVKAHAGTREDGRQMATTLTMMMAVWPWSYVVQVGDSRAYHYADGNLRQITRDQTVAADLVKDGILSVTDARRSPYNNVLSSAIGADEATPEVTRVQIVRGGAMLVCSDGLTKHVSDDEIRKVLHSGMPSEKACQTLLDMALDRGGTDNITIVIGQAPKSKK